MPKTAKIEVQGLDRSRIYRVFLKDTEVHCSHYYHEAMAYAMGLEEGLGRPKVHAFVETE